MIRQTRIGNQVVVMLAAEKDGKVVSLDMRVIPLVVYHNIEKGFRYDQVH